jgi:photosystem II stability/assembly factor-like uncharacterized protein
MLRFRVLLVAAMVVGAACTSSSPNSNDKTNAAARSTTSTAPATTSSTAAPATCPKLRANTAPGAVAALTDIQMVGPQKGFAVGRGLIAVTDDGRTWTPRYTGGANFVAVDAVDPNHAWAVGDRALYGTVDGGKHWPGLGSPDDGTVLRQVHFIDEHFGWGVGRNGKLYRSGDGGHTWGELMPPCGAEAVCFTAQDDGWEAAGNRIDRSTNGGDTWTPVLTIPGDDQVNGWHPLALQCTRGGVAWATFGGDNAAMSHSPFVAYRGTADGQWTAVMREPMTAAAIKAPDSGSYPGPISAIGPDSAAFVTFTPPADPNPTNLVMATDNGRHLEPPKPIPGLLQPAAAAFVSAQAGWVIGAKVNGPDVILATADGGQTWPEQYSRPSPAK